MTGRVPWHIFLRPHMNQTRENLRIELQNRGHSQDEYQNDQPSNRCGQSHNSEQDPLVLRFLLQSTVFVAEEDSEIVGFYGLRDRGDHVELLRMFPRIDRIGRVTVG